MFLRKSELYFVYIALFFVNMFHQKIWFFLKQWNSKSIKVRLFFTYINIFHGHRNHIVVFKLYYRFNSNFYLGIWVTKKNPFGHFFCKNRCNFVYQDEKPYNQSYGIERLQSLQKPTRMCHVLWWRQVSNHKNQRKYF